MELTAFKPKYSPLVWMLVALYAAPWLFSLPNAILGRSTADWRLFWLLSGSVWAIAGLLHLKGVLLKRITFSRDIEIEMVLQKPASQSAAGAVRVLGDTVAFRERAVPTQYLANASALMGLLAAFAGKGRLNLVYEAHGRNDAGWSMEKNLFALICFAVYMMAMLALRVRPLRVIGPATDALLLGWAVMLPVLLLVKLVKWVKERTERREAAPKWI